MAITVVNVATTISAASSWSVNVPSGTQDGDLLVFAGSSDAASRNINTHASFTNVTATGLTAGEIADGADQCLKLFYRIASSEPASYTITGNNTIRGVSALIALRGIDTTTPFNAGAGQATTSGTSHATPSITPNVTGCMLLGVFTRDGGALGSWTSDLTTEQWDVAETVSFVTTAGYTETYNSTSAVSRTGTSDASDTGIAVLLAIAPAAAATKAPPPYQRQTRVITRRY